MSGESDVADVRQGQHWILFDRDRCVIGCHCGFNANQDSDACFGDSVVEHFFAAALADAAEELDRSGQSRAAVFVRALADKREAAK